MTADELLDAFDAAWSAACHKRRAVEPLLTDYLLPDDDPQAERHRCHLEEIEREYRLKTVNGRAPSANNTGGDPSGSLGSEFPRLPGFAFDSVIGRGGKGVVYRARQLSMNRMVAIKTLSPENASSVLNVERLRNEARILGSLQHPHLVTIYSLEESDRALFLVMEYIDGVDLEERMERSGCTVRDAARFMITAAEAIHAAHLAGVLHRDIKPSNILVDHQDVLRVTDFGLSRQQNQSNNGTALTASVEVLGTPGYISPEQAAGRTRDLRETADVYGLGATLYHLLTGRAPFVGDSLFEVLQHVQNSEPPAPRLLKTGIPVPLQTICLKCLEKLPAQRYQSAKELAEDLRRFLNGEPVRAQPISRAARLRRWCRKNPFTTTLLSMVVALLVITFGLLADRNATMTRDLSDASEVNARLRQALQRERDANQLVYDSQIRRAVLEYEANQLDNVRKILDQTAPASADPQSPPWEWRWLNGLLQTSEFQFQAADDDAEWVGALAFSPDGRQLVAGSRVPLYQDRRRGTFCRLQVFDLSGSTDPVNLGPVMSVVALQFSKDGRTLYVAECDIGYDRESGLTFGPGRVRRWQTDGWTELPAIAETPSAAELLLTDDEQHCLVLDGHDRTPRQIRAFSIHTPHTAVREFQTWWPSTTAQAMICQDAQGKEDVFVVQTPCVYSPGAPQESSWEIHTAQHLLKCNIHNAGAQRSRLDIHQKPDGRLQQTMLFESLECVALDKQEQRLAVATRLGEIHVWNTDTWTEILRLRGHKARVRCLVFSPDAKRLASGDWNGEVRIWDLARSASFTETLAPRRATSVEAFAVSNQGEIVALVAGKPLQHIRIGEERSSVDVDLMSPDRLIAPGRQVDISQDGRRVASVWSQDETTAVLCDTRTGQVICSLPPHGSRVSFVRMSHDLVATAAWPASEPAGTHKDQPGELRLSTEDGSALFSTVVPRSRIFRIAVSSDGQSISAAVMTYQSDGQQKNSVITWDVPSGVMVDEFPMSSWVLALEYGPHDELWATDFYEGDLVIRRPRSHVTVRRHPGFALQVQDLAFSPDEPRLAAVTRTRLILWNIESVRKVLELPLKTLESDFVFTPRVRFSPDGNLLLAGQVDGTIRSWKATSPDQVQDSISRQADAAVTDTSYTRQP